MKLAPVIGLEIHVQLNTESKMFCGCSAESFGKRPNTRVCPVCLGLPGAIPGPPNIEAIKKAVLVATALNCQLAEECRFERKNYFYPDLPKGYQISQYQTAIGKKGKFSTFERQRESKERSDATFERSEQARKRSDATFERSEQARKRSDATWGGGGEIKITRVHLEEDAAKLIHEPGQTLIDFNRAGVPLLEIVTEPDLETPAQAKAVLKELRTLLRHLKVSDADMEKGSMRLEGNISLKKEGAQTLPDYKVELKNINSFNFLVRALEKEIERQRILLRMGKKVVQETRGYSEERDATFSQRRKEKAFDYRYFPEPDLPPLTAKLLTHEGKITLPGKQRVRLEQKYHLSRQYIDTLLADPELIMLFEEVIRKAKKLNPKEVANAIVNRRFGDPKKLGVKGLSRAMKASKEKVRMPEAKVNQHIDKLILDNPKAVGDYKAGKEPVLQFLLGALMRETKGKIDPSEARELLKKKLQSVR